MRTQENIFHGRFRLLGFDTWYDDRGWVESYRFGPGEGQVWMLRELSSWHAEGIGNVCEGVARPGFPADPPLIIVYSYFPSLHIVSLKPVDCDTVTDLNEYRFHTLVVKPAPEDCLWLYVSVPNTQRYLLSRETLRLQ